MSDSRNSIKPCAFAFSLFCLMAILSIAFHHPLEIVDALSSEPIPGFGIRISAWRIILEPLAGPLLFYLRANQPVGEFAVLFLWILAISLVVAVWRTILQTKKPGDRPGPVSTVSWLKAVPMIAGIWLGLLWLIIYIPLPANTIVNQNDDAILINTHSHTEYSHDGIISTRRLQRWHGKNGFDAFFLTDHNHHQKSMEAVGAQNSGKLAGKPLLICGEEFSGGNHMTLLGLTGDFITRGMTDQQVIDTTHAQNGVVIVAHWFDDERKTLPYFIGMGVDGFEIANQGTGLTYDRRVFKNIVDACKANGLVMLGAADYHGYGSSCFVWNPLEIQGWHQMDPDGKRESILELLRRSDMDSIRVLIYRDRQLFGRAPLLLSPLYNAFGYFRTLNALQLLSWCAWLAVFTVVRRRYVQRRRCRGILTALGMLSLASTLFLLVNGVVLWFRGSKLEGYNEIYREYGTIMLLCGAVFLVYNLALVMVSARNRRIETHKTDII